VAVSTSATAAVVVVVMVVIRAVVAVVAAALVTAGVVFARAIVVGFGAGVDTADFRRLLSHAFVVHDVLIPSDTTILYRSAAQPQRAIGRTKRRLQIRGRLRVRG